MVVICVVALVAAALVADPAALRRRAPHAVEALAVGVGLGVALLAWPVWFALEGPAHLSGLVWPNVGVIGGFIPSSFVATGYPPGPLVFLPLGGYEGPRWPRRPTWAGASWPSWSAGLAAFWRDRRLWFFGFVLAVCVACSLGERRGQWEPAWIFTRIPVVENVIEQRFMAIGFLAAAVMLAVILDRVHAPRPTGGARWARSPSRAVALVPMAAIFGERLPFTMQPVILPRWYTEVAPTLPPGGCSCRTRRRSRASSPPWPGRPSTACTTARRAAGARRGWRAGPARPQPGSRCSAALSLGVGCPSPPAPRPSSPPSAMPWRSGRSTRW